MKTVEREKCRVLREQGLSVKQIAREVGVSQGSVSYWVRDILLTDEQRNILTYGGGGASPEFLSQIREKALANHRRRREECRAQGRKKAQERDWLHTVGCMLYWGEGSKGNAVCFTNSSTTMMSLFVRFLRESLDVQDSQITMVCSQDIDFWLGLLNLPMSCIRKASVDQRPRSGRKKNILEHGMCRVNVCSIALLEHILGAIEEYGTVA